MHVLIRSISSASGKAHDDDLDSLFPSPHVGACSSADRSCSHAADREDKRYLGPNADGRPVPSHVSRLSGKSTGRVAPRTIELGSGSSWLGMKPAVGVDMTPDLQPDDNHLCRAGERLGPQTALDIGGRGGRGWLLVRGISRPRGRVRHVVTSRHVTSAAKAPGRVTVTLRERERARERQAQVQRGPGLFSRTITSEKQRVTATVLPAQAHMHGSREAWEWSWRDAAPSSPQRSPTRRSLA